MPLTDTAIRAVRPTGKIQKIFDGHGLYLHVSAIGTKTWRFKYRFLNKEKLLTLGTYPIVSLKEARQKANDARKEIDNGIDPSAKRKIEKLQAANTFEAVAREWHELQAQKWTENYAKRVMYMLVRNAFHVIGSKPVNQITTPEILMILKKVEARGIIGTAHALKQVCSNIMRYAVITGRAEHNPAADLRGALAPYIKKHRPALTTPERVGRLMYAIYHYTGSMVIKSALKIMALTFCRTGEIRFARWNEFDFENKIWRIPGERMKMRKDHLVPLSRQTINVLEQLREYSGDGVFVFPSYYDESKPFGKSVLLKAIMNMGFEKGEMCPHGFRSMASTLLNELGYNRDWIERQLAHVPHEQVRGIYNRAEYLAERTRMLQEWADYLDELREKAKEEIRAEELGIRTDKYRQRKPKKDSETLEIANDEITNRISFESIADS